PERRIVASAPVVGGANLPRPPFEPHLPQAAHSEPNVPRIEPNLPTGADESPYYFLNDFSAPNAAEPSVKGVEDNYSVAQSFQLPHGDQLKSLLMEDRFATNTPTQSSASSAFYFLDLPQSGQSYSHYQPSQPIFVASSAQPLDVHAIRRDFPILQERVNGRPLVWFDNAATTQKPQRVIDRIAYFYQHENSNIHRAAHELAARATDAYEHARNVVARFISAPSSKEIIFVRGTTEGINLIAKTWGEQNIGEGDEIIVSHLEHHANIVPWYQLTKKTGAKLRV
ncbi:aminotransferase class V-fold PLP-dependent enzyme, partial [Acinetobacter baumannii]